MKNTLLTPLEFYLEGGKDTHMQYAAECFDRHLEASGVDPGENQQLAEAYEASETAFHELKSSRSYRVLFTVLAVILIGLGIGLLMCWEESIWYPVIGGCILIIACIWLFGKVIPELTSLNQKISEQRAEADALLLPPKEQLQALDRCFDPRDSVTLIEKTVPGLHFHDFFSREHQADLECCDLQMLSDRNSSVTRTLAGDYRGNPFLFSTVLHHSMRSHEYTGSKTIYWQEKELQYVPKERSYTDRDGNTQTETYYEWEYVTVDKEETLRASVTAPVPDYRKESSLGYGHPLAPELTFSRKPRHIQKKSEEGIQSRVTRRARSLHSKSERAIGKGESYLMMANEEFEVLFDASDRNNEHQFRVLFTPQAQQNMVALLKDSTLIGDEFAFRKCGRYNVIPCDEKLLLESPTHYHDYSVQEARKRFLDHHQEYFRAVFGVFAPILAIPGYQDPPQPRSSPAGPGHFARYEHEAVANHFPLSMLVTGDCKTAAILKTSLLETTDTADIVQVVSHGYTTRDRVETFRIKGGDGCYHDVDVDWVEYLPRTKTTTIRIEALPGDTPTQVRQPGTIRCRGLTATIIESL